MFSNKSITVGLVFLSLAFLMFSCSDSSVGPGDGNNQNPAEFDSQAAPGDSAHAFLSDEQYTTLQVEIDYMPGHEPTQEGLDSLRTFLQRRLNKDEIIFREPTEITSGNQSSYTADSIRSLEEDHRDYRTEAGSNTLQAYFLYVDGEYEQSNVLGIAYWNTSVAFFGQTIEEISGTPPAAPRPSSPPRTARRATGSAAPSRRLHEPAPAHEPCAGSACAGRRGCIFRTRAAGLCRPCGRKGGRYSGQ